MSVHLLQNHVRERKKKKSHVFEFLCLSSPQWLATLEEQGFILDTLIKRSLLRDWTALHICFPPAGLRIGTSNLNEACLAVFIGSQCSKSS